MSTWGFVPEWADGRASVKPLINARAEATWLNQHRPLDEAQALLASFPAELLTLYEVSPRVNSPTYNTLDALHPVTHVQTPTGDR